MLTIDTLITQLESLKAEGMSGDTILVVQGCEGGLSHLEETSVQQIEAILNYRNSSYMGDHEELEDYTFCDEEDREGYVIVKAIKFAR